MRKLLLSIIIDNSSSMKGEKISKLKAALRTFQEMINFHQIQKNLEYSLIGFSNLEAKVFKHFEDENVDLNSINEGGLALLNQAINLGISNLEKKLNEYKKEGYDLYKPWLILLSDGQSFEDLDKSLPKLIELVKNKQITYFPFALSDNKCDERLESLYKVKIPLVVINNLYDKLFNWLFETVYKRVTTPIGTGIRLERSSFAGWIK